MLTKVQRRFKKQFDDQVRLERNGAPVPPEIAARMTKPKAPDILWQVVVTKRATRQLIPIGPMMDEEACGMLAEAINVHVAAGKEKDWMKAEIVCCTPIGVN